MSEQFKEGSDFEALKAALIAHYESDEYFDDTALNILYTKIGTMRELIGFVIHDLGTMESLAVSAGSDAEAAIRRAEKAEGHLESATQPLAPEMARLNETVTRLNDELAAAKRAISDVTRERDNLYRCVKFYADGNHADLEGWEAPEEPNWICPPLEIEGEEPQLGPWSPDRPPPKKVTVSISPPWMVEDGGIARFVLAGGKLPENMDECDEGFRLTTNATPLAPPLPEVPK